MKNRSFSALVASGLLLATATLALTACGRTVLYKDPEHNYAGRPIPPSNLLQRVMATYTANGSSGGAEVLDGLRDLRGNVQNTIKFFNITGYSEALPTTIFNFPEQTTGYVFSSNDGALSVINYSKESGGGVAATFAANAPSAAAAPAGATFAGAAEQAGLLVLNVGGASYNLNLPNVYKVVTNVSGTVTLAMVRNSDTLYRIVQLPSTVNPVLPPGEVDCQPVLLPVFCVVPVAGTYDRPSNASFSLDGSTVYVLNSGPELGGKESSVTFLQTAKLNVNLVPTVNPLSVGAPSPMSSLPVANPVPIPGGATVSLADNSYLYIAGQQLQTSGAYNGLFAGKLTLLNLSSYTVGDPISISDGTHTRLLFADDNTLWIGASQCANGVRAAVAAQQLASAGVTTQDGNYNCLTMAKIGSSTPTAQVLPVVTQVPSGATGGTGVPYPNTNQNPYYYGSLTGICWVQNYHKVYTAYGGQVHAFYTGVASNPITVSEGQNPNGGPAGTELNNFNFTVQGTVLDVAYMDAETNSAN